MKLNNMTTPDTKLVFAEPEMEIVMFDESDIETGLYSGIFEGQPDYVEGGEDEGVYIP